MAFLSCSEAQKEVAPQGRLSGTVVATDKAVIWLQALSPQTQRTSVEIISKDCSKWYKGNKQHEIIMLQRAGGIGFCDGVAWKRLPEGTSSWRTNRLSVSGRGTDSRQVPRRGGPWQVLRQWLAFSFLTPIYGIKSIFFLQSRTHMHPKQKFHVVLLLHKILKCTLVFSFTSGS